MVVMVLVVVMLVVVLVVVMAFWQNVFLVKNFSVSIVVYTMINFKS